MAELKTFVKEKLHSQTDSQKREVEILKGLPDQFDAYFVHSFHVVAKKEPDIAGITDYQGKFTSIVASGPVFGVQFHPEKSQSAGLAILESFAKCQKGEK